MDSESPANRTQNLLVLLEMVIDVAKKDSVDRVRGQVGGLLCTPDGHDLRLAFRSGLRGDVIEKRFRDIDRVNLSSAAHLIRDQASEQAGPCATSATLIPGLRARVLRISRRFT